MTLLPDFLTGTSVCAWRLEREIYAKDWGTAEGAYRVGGRWSPAGMRVLYTALDPATTILEVAVHKGFDALDRVAHQLLKIELQAAGAHIVKPETVPNPNWLHPGIVSVNQQSFGRELLTAHAVVLVPSVVSRHSWNLLVNMEALKPLPKLITSERFALDVRLLSS
ncbi:RES domain-containing protein [bacterium]|nr:RES domain-containing protein [bacterium]